MIISITNQILGVLFVGLIIGWFSLVSDILTIVGCLFSIIFLSIYTCDDLRNLLVDSRETMNHPGNFNEVCQPLKGGKSVITFTIQLRVTKTCSFFFSFHYRLSNLYFDCLWIRSYLIFVYQRN